MQRRRWRQKAALAPGPPRPSKAPPRALQPRLPASMPVQASSTARRAQQREVRMVAAEAANSGLGCRPLVPATPLRLAAQRQGRVQARRR